MSYGYIGPIRTRAGHRDEVVAILPGTRAAIGRAVPMLTGEFTRQELTVTGGLGLG